MWYMIITCFDTQRYQDFVSLRWRPTSKPWSWMYMMRLGNPGIWRWIWRWISVDLDFGCVSLCFFFLFVCFEETVASSMLRDFDLGVCFHEKQWTAILIFHLDDGSTWQPSSSTRIDLAITEVSIKNKTETPWSKVITPRKIEMMQFVARFRMIDNAWQYFIVSDNAWPKFGGYATMICA